MENITPFPDRHGRFADTQTHIAALTKENGKLKEEVGMWKRLYEKANIELKRLKAYLSWENRLFATPSTKMSDAQKIVTRLVPQVEKQAQKRQTTDSGRDDGLVRIFPNEFTQGSGKSEDRIGATLKQLDGIGLITYKAERVYDGSDRLPRTQVFMASTERLKNLEVLDTATPRNHGGKRVICKSCGTELVNVKKVIQGTCPSCGEVHTYDPQKKEDAAFIVDMNTAENWQEWYEDLPGGSVDPSARYEMEHDRDTSPTMLVPSIEKPVPSKQRVLCGHDKSYWYKRVDGSPGCELCDAPWEGGKQ